MKFKNLAIICVGISVLFFCIVPLAEAGRGCTGINTDPLNYIQVDKTAPGTKYNATMTLFYDPMASCATTPAPANMRDMHIFLRIEGNMLKGFHDAGGSELAPFAAIAECVPYWNDFYTTGQQAIAEQQLRVNEFFRLVVNPRIYSWNHPEDPDGCVPGATDTSQMCPPFAVKSIDNIVEGDVLNETDMTIMDIVIAIED